METRTREMVTLKDGEVLQGVFLHGRHGYFCDELNGIPWDYEKWGSQVAKANQAEAAQALWDYACEDAEDNFSFAIGSEETP